MKRRDADGFSDNDTARVVTICMVVVLVLFVLVLGPVLGLMG